MNSPETVFGMSHPTYTLAHVLISLVGIASGLVVLFGLVTAKRLEGWTALFLATTVATSVTGFGFPFVQLLPFHIVGVISLIVLSQATQRTLNITSASTNPSRGCANACGRRPTISKP